MEQVIFGFLGAKRQVGRGEYVKARPHKELPLRVEELRLSPGEVTIISVEVALRSEKPRITGAELGPTRREFPLTR